jgi:hypothetical protein
MIDKKNRNVRGTGTVGTNLNCLHSLGAKSCTVLKRPLQSRIILYKVLYILHRVRHSPPHPS